MNKSHRDIKGESLMNLQQRIEEIGDSQREVYIKPPEKDKGSWIEEFFLNRVWDFIKKSFEFAANAEIKDGHVFIDITVRIAKRTIFSERIKVI